MTYAYITQLYSMSIQPSNKAAEHLVNRPLSLKSSRMRNRIAYAICLKCVCVGGWVGVLVCVWGGGGASTGLRIAIFHGDEMGGKDHCRDSIAPVVE